MASLLLSEQLVLRIRVQVRSILRMPLVTSKLGMKKGDVYVLGGKVAM